MITRTLLELLSFQAECSPDNPAVSCGEVELSYAELHRRCVAFAVRVQAAGVVPGDRVALYLGNTIETVVGMFGAAAARVVFVPINPILKASQVQHILRDSGAKLLVTNSLRANSVRDAIDSTPSLEHLVLVDGGDCETQITQLAWSEFDSTSDLCYAGHETDVAAILYTSGSTGSPKGVVLSQANMTIGALSVADYLGNNHTDRILALLPLSFDAGFSQVSTAFASGAAVHLQDFFLPQDAVKSVKKRQITGITGVPPLWHQLAAAKWEQGAADSVRYIANTGGKMPRPLLGKLRVTFPKAKPFLMYGLTEAFRSTYLDPAMSESKPDSIGKAIPNAEIMVVNEQGQICKPRETGELVHSGPLVAQGYWNDPERTAERYKPSPTSPPGLVKPTMAVWSGDKVFTDEDGYLYFVGREDEMIKSSGYRISPSDLEDAILDCADTQEVAAFGVPDERLGQVIAIFLVGSCSETELLKDLKSKLPAYMIPSIVHRVEKMPKNPNGKIDRAALRQRLDQAEG